MRCGLTEVSMKIPVPLEGKEIKGGNFTVYTESVIADACKNAKHGLPIIRYDDEGKAVCIGVTESIRWNSEGYIEADGCLWRASTTETIKALPDNASLSMEITSVGIN